jgi:AcrR family transcriptional regulator
MASDPRAGGKRLVTPPAEARPRAASTAWRRASADAPGPISRGAGARQRVLRAALEVLDEDGLPGFTMEAVARRAGASKATLYRHWPTAGALMIDAMDATFQPFEVPDTGRVEADVAQLLTAFVTLLEHTPFPRLLAAFIDAAERDPALADLHADLTRRRREPLLVVLARARERGQVPNYLDPEIITDLLTGPFFYRRFIAHRPIPPDLINDVIGYVLHRPHRATTDRRTGRPGGQARQP